jgi:hypothetical protein
MLNVEVGDAVLMIFESGAGPADLASAERTVPSPADGDCFGSPKPHPPSDNLASIGTALAHRRRALGQRPRRWREPLPLGRVAQLATIPSPPTASATVIEPIGVRDPSEWTRNSSTIPAAPV